MNKHYRVTGRFMIDTEGVVVAKSEAEAKRKLRDTKLKRLKLKTKHWQKDEANILDEW